MTEIEVKLRQFIPEDAPRMQELANNPKISNNLRDAFPHPYALAHAEGFIKHSREMDPPMVFAITYGDDYVGNIGLARGKDVYRNTAEVGYFIGEPYWNRGIATRALSLIVDYGFQELGLTRIHTGVYAYNTASMRVLEKCGFIKEGVFRAAVFKSGNTWDEHRYAITSPDQQKEKTIQ